MPEGVADLGRPATDGEVAAWDIDVRPDFVGLPSGSGDVWEGEEIWLAQCASCHGDFGDSNEIFAPLVLGNITEEDIATGRVASLTDPAVTRTTLMKVPTLSTLWDYIYRAMPWNAPKTLSPDEVYGLVAYILNLGYLVEDDFVLSDTNMAETQARMPNRNGMSLDHGMWSVSGLPDVSGSSCITDCDVAITVTSSLPAYAMNAHGNLAEQVRGWGPYPGLWTETVTDAEPAQIARASDVAEVAMAPEAALSAGGCSGCHQMAGQLVGPGFDAIRARYAGQEHAAYLRDKIVNGGAGVWGAMPMPPMPTMADDALQQIVAWLTSGGE
jgi:cytochrome c